MSLPNLVSNARAQTVSALAALTSPTLDTLLAEASETVRGITHRDLSSSSYSELYSGGDRRIVDPLRLRQYPVHRITRLATNPVNAVLVQNNGSTCQRATVETLEDGSGLRLQYQINGATLATQDFIYATYTTLATLTAAITAFGNGFTASVANTAPNFDISKAASSDLWPIQGAATCLGSGAYITYYAEEILPYNNMPNFYEGDIWTGQMYGWRLDGETGEIYGRFPRGDMNVRIDYTAGFTTIPDDIQRATLIIAKYLYDSGNLNYTVKESRLGRAAQVVAQQIAYPPAAMSILNRYIAHDRVIYRN